MFGDNSTRSLIQNGCQLVCKVYLIVISYHRLSIWESGNLNHIICKAYLPIIVTRNFCYFPPFVLYQCVNCQAVQWCFPYLVLATCMFGISSSNEHFIILHENTYISIVHRCGLFVDWYRIDLMLQTTLSYRWVTFVAAASLKTKQYQIKDKWRHDSNWISTDCIRIWWDMWIVQCTRITPILNKNCVILFARS